MFNDYDNAEMFNTILQSLKPFGFEDTTYGNDECPSISLVDPEGDIIIRIWVEYLDPKLREGRDLITVYTGEDRLGDDYEIPCHDAQGAILTALDRFRMS